MLVHGSNYLMYTMPKSTEKTSKSTPKKKKIKTIPDAGSPWAYREFLYTIKETDALSIDDILQLDCRAKYKVRPNIFVVDEITAKDEMFRLFGEMMGQDVRFMRQWVRCFVLTHRRFVMKLAKTHLTEHSLSLPRWLKAITNGCRVDTLCLYILSIATETVSYTLKLGFEQHWERYQTHMQNIASAATST